ncbi:MAG: hypothetical protein SFU98_03100 [Leptospiraceae bacterium]|nr:hypothetical protein [Leptospiraceae bacterium]
MTETISSPELNWQGILIMVASISFAITLSIYCIYLLFKNKKDL